MGDTEKSSILPEQSSDPRSLEEGGHLRCDLEASRRVVPYVRDTATQMDCASCIDLQLLRTLLVLLRVVLILLFGYRAVVSLEFHKKS